MMAKEDLCQVTLMIELALEWLENRSAKLDTDLDGLRFCLASAMNEAQRLASLGVMSSD